MASYHCAVKSDSGRTTASRHAQYNCREGIYEYKSFDHADYTSRSGKYQEKNDLEASGHGNMPSWAKEDPQEFWKTADNYERANGRRYTEIEIALPNELNPEQRLELVKEFIAEQLGENHPYSFGIHCPKAKFNPEVDQPHAHIMFSERKLDGIERDKELFFRRSNPKNPELGGTKKDRDWSNINKIDQVRKEWEVIQNKYLEKYGHEVRVDCRSLKAQREEAILKGDYEKAAKLDREPEKHLGPNLANRVSRELSEHLKEVSSKEEFQVKRNQYYDQVEASEKVRQVAYIRDLKHTEKQIENLENNNPELAQSKIDAGQALQFAETIYIEEKLKELRPQLEEIQRQRSQFFKDLQAYQKVMPIKPTTEEQKKYNQESIDLKIKIKELKQKEAEIRKEIEQIKQSAKSSNAQAEIRKISEKIQSEQEQKIENNKIQYRERLAQERRIAFLENKRTPYTAKEAKELATARYIEQLNKPYKLELEQIWKDRKEFYNQLKEHQNNIPVNPSQVEKREFNQKTIALKVELKNLRIKEEEVRKQMEAVKENINKPEAQKEIDRSAEEILKQSQERAEKEQQLKTNQQEQYKMKREQEKAAEKAAWERRFDLEHKKTPLTESEAKELAIDRYLEKETESKQTELEQVKQEKIDYIKELRTVQENLNKNILEAEERKRLEREDKDLKIKLKDLKVREIDLKKEIEKEKEELLKKEEVKREIDQQAKEIYKESFLKTANQEQLKSKLEEVNGEIKKCDLEKAELSKQICTEKQADAIAKATYTKGATTELIKERSALNKEQKNLDESIKKHQENKPKMFDFEGKKAHENEGKRLDELKKDFEQRYKENELKVGKVREQLQKPEAIKQVESIKQSVLQRNISNLERIEKVDKKLGELIKDRADIMKRQIRLGQEKVMKKELERMNPSQKQQKNSAPSQGQSKTIEPGRAAAQLLSAAKQIANELERSGGAGGGLSIRLSHDDDNRMKDNDLMF